MELGPFVNCNHPSVDPTVQDHNSETLWDTLTKLDSNMKHFQTMWTDLVQ